MFLLQRKHILSVFASVGVALALLLPARVAADAYGNGTYNSCNYNQTNCPTSGGSTTGTRSTSSVGGTNAPSTQTSGAAILLNNYNEYFTDYGKSLDLQLLQVVYFEVQVGGKTQKYSVTIKEIGTNFAVLSISNVKDLFRMIIGQTAQFDVTGDGINDIVITLNSITNKKANLNFRQLSPAPKTVSATQPISAVTTTHKNWLPIIISSIIFLFGLAWSIWLIARRRTRQRGINNF